jgi:hypothetical protein
MTDEQFVQFVLPPTKTNPCLKMQGEKEIHYAKKDRKIPAITDSGDFTRCCHGAAHASGEMVAQPTRVRAA